MTMTDTPAAIAAQGMRKSYGDRVVLDGIDLTIPRGTIFSLLGPNGAGKTTAVKILTTLIPADGGTMTVAGHDLARDPDGVRGSIGVTGQFSAVDVLLTAEENLRLMADLWHLKPSMKRRRVAELVEQFDLTEVAKKPAALYSGGTKRRLDLAMTLVGSPQVIFLDEPTTGLDPRSRRAMWQIIRELVAGGTTIFLTTQYLEEADQLADRIAVLDQGRIVAEGGAEELKRRLPGGHIQLQFARTAELEAAAIALGHKAEPNHADLTLQIPGDGSVPLLRSVLDALDSAAIPVEKVSLHTPDLDDVFLALTGQPHAETVRNASA
jgi:ABC-2 type transport system ATP-binding protein